MLLLLSRDGNPLDFSDLFLRLHHCSKDSTLLVAMNHHWIVQLFEFLSIVILTVHGWMEYNRVVQTLVLNFKKVYDSVRGEILYNILTVFGIPMKLLSLMKICWN